MNQPRNLPATPKPRRLRRVALAGALLLSGVLLGVGTSAMSQGHGPRGGANGEWMPERAFPSGPGPMHRGGMMFGPGSVERMVNRLAHIVDASSEQTQKMNTIAQRMAEGMLPLHQRHLAGRQQIGEILAAPSIDRARLEAVRAEQVKLVDDASKRIIVAMADIAEAMNPAQRELLGQMMQRHHRPRHL